MTEQLPKYIKVKSLQEANEKSDLYSVSESIVYTYTPDGVPGAIMTDVEYRMSLREESKYDNVEKFMKKPIEDYEQDVPEGWSMIHHTSKEVVLVKKGIQPKLSVIREALINIFQIAEDNDVKDSTIMDQIYKLSEKALGELDGDNRESNDETRGTD